MSTVEWLFSVFDDETNWVAETKIGTNSVTTEGDQMLEIITKLCHIYYKSEKLKALQLFATCCHSFRFARISKSCGNIEEIYMILSRVLFVDVDPEECLKKNCLLLEKSLQRQIFVVERLNTAKKKHKYLLEVWKEVEEEVSTWNVERGRNMSWESFLWK